VFGVFLAQKLAGEPLTVVGDGEQTRDFTFVTDVVDAMIKAVESDSVGECFNVGSGDTYSVNHLVGLLGAEKVGIPKRPGEPDCTFADIEKIQRRLNWRPNVSFGEGVKIMLDNIHLWDEAPLWNSATISTATEDWFRYLDDQIESTAVAGNEQP
jgi:UDP-glucose 4-epimerase